MQYTVSQHVRAINGTQETLETTWEDYESAKMIATERAVEQPLRTFKVHEIYESEGLNEESPLLYEVTVNAREF
jgi:hypothetical protein